MIGPKVFKNARAERRLSTNRGKTRPGEEPAPDARLARSAGGSRGCLGKHARGKAETLPSERRDGAAAGRACGGHRALDSRRARPQTRPRRNVERCVGLFSRLHHGTLDQSLILPVCSKNAQNALLIRDFIERPEFESDTGNTRPRKSRSARARESFSNKRRVSPRDFFFARKKTRAPLLSRRAGRFIAAGVSWAAPCVSETGLDARGCSGTPSTREKARALAREKKERKTG